MSEKLEEFECYVELKKMVEYAREKLPEVEDNIEKATKYLQKHKKQIEDICDNAHIKHIFYTDDRIKRFCAKIKKPADINFDKYFNKEFQKDLLEVERRLSKTLEKYKGILIRELRIFEIIPWHLEEIHIIFVADFYVTYEIEKFHLCFEGVK